MITAHDLKCAVFAIVSGLFFVMSSFVCFVEPTKLGMVIAILCATTGAIGFAAWVGRIGHSGEIPVFPVVLMDRDQLKKENEQQ